MKLSKLIDRIAKLLRIKAREPASLSIVPSAVAAADERALILFDARNRWMERAIAAEEKLQKYTLEGFESFIQVYASEQVQVPLFRAAEPDGSGFKWRWDWDGKPGREWDKVSLTIEHEGLLRVIAGPVMTEPVFLSILAHKQTPLQVNIQSLLYADAGEPTTIWIFSRNPFKVVHVDAHLRLSPDIIRKFREKQLSEEGCVGSIPDPKSMAGKEFYREHPEMLP